MAKLLKRGDEVVRAAQARRVKELAARLRELLRGASIETEEARVLVTGRGLLKRWLIDPQLRFLTGDRQ